MFQKKQNLFHPFFIIAVAITVLSACQSPAPHKTSSSSSVERPLNVIRTSDGVQNIAWKIKTIEGKPAKYFFQQPGLQFNSQTKTLQGNTGCNVLFGSYQLSTQKQQLEITAKAGHQSCDNALAQEADLMQTLAAVQRYQLSGNTLNLLNNQNKIVMVLQR